MKILVLLFGLTFLTSSFRSSLPEVNKQVVTFCKAQVGKKVARGECWDLAQAALDHAQAKWKAPLNYGIKYNYKKETILPGDIIQFEKVSFKWDMGAMSFPHHTAIVVENKGDKRIVIAHQNFAGSKKVQLTEINLNYKLKGTLDFYHPVGN